MNSQLLLLINFLVIAGLVIYFMSSRTKSQSDAILDLSKPSEPILKQQDELMKEQPELASPPELLPEPTPVLQSVPELQPSPPTEVVVANELKPEVVYFAYNSHEWEAHEVLGLKQGVDLAQATQHYQDLIKKSDPSTFEFYDAAFAAILRLKRNQW